MLEVLSGTNLTATADAYGLSASDLADAVAAYQTAGRTALDQRDDDGWYHVRIQLPDWQHAESIATRHLLPAFTHLRDRGATTSWWFLRKHPYWRFRFHHAHHAAVDHELDRLTQHNILRAWNPGIYEAETTAFGGPIGAGVVHDLFCADSREAIRAFGAIDPRRREISLLLLTALFHAAGLDWFERGDVFARLTQLRPLPASSNVENARQLEVLADRIRPLLTAHITANGMDTLSLVPSKAWLEAHATAGSALRDAAAAGQLHRGLRAVLTQIVIFHWNRLGLGATTQAILAAAATTATLEGTHTPWTPKP